MTPYTFNVSSISQLMLTELHGGRHETHHSR